MAKRRSGSKKAPRGKNGLRKRSLVNTGTDKRFTRQTAGGQFRTVASRGSRPHPNQSEDTTALPAHVETTPGVRGGRPRISGRRITVDDIVIMHLRLGQAVEEIVAKYDLTFAAVHAALAFYFDHKDEVDRRIAADDAFVEALKRDNPSPLRERLKALRDA